MGDDAFSPMRELCASFAVSVDRLEQLQMSVSDPSIAGAIVRTKDLRLMAGFTVAVGECHCTALMSLACMLYQIALAECDCRRLWVKSLPRVLRLTGEEFDRWPRREIIVTRQRAVAELANVLPGELFRQVIEVHIARICCQYPNGRLATRTKNILRRWLVG